jgi:hypothetical protein
MVASRFGHAANPRVSVSEDVAAHNQLASPEVATAVVNNLQPHAADTPKLSQLEGSTSHAALVAVAPMPHTAPVRVVPQDTPPAAVASLPAGPAIAPEPRSVAIAEEVKTEPAVALEPTAVAIVEPKPVEVFKIPSEEKTNRCKTYDTKMRFYPDIVRAKEEAKKEKKLLFVLHISGDFDDPGFT